MKKIKLGHKYRDSVSGWEGIATAEYRYMNGCTRIELGGRDKDGQPKEFVFDVQQIEEAKEPRSVAVVDRKTGGPQTSTPVSPV